MKYRVKNAADQQTYLIRVATKSGSKPNKVSIKGRKKNDFYSVQALLNLVLKLWRRLEDSIKLSQSLRLNAGRIIRVSERICGLINRLQD